jgi:DNA-binding FadR family transcriptional regulator
MRKHGVDRATLKSLTRRMSADLLDLPPGAFLGVEDDVLKRYGVSRPTLRQAARVLEYQKLLSVRAGVRGGYYVTRPAFTDLAGAVGLFLRAQGVTFSEFLSAARGMHQTVAAMSANSTDAELRSELQAERDLYAAAAQAGSLSRFIEAEVRLYHLVGRLAGNRVLGFFVDVLFELGAEDATVPIFREHPDRIARMSSLRLKLVDAILASDAEIAQVHSKRISDQLDAWMAEDTEAERAAPKLRKA